VKVADTIGAGVAASPLPTVGASGAIFGLLLAYGMLFPEQQVIFFIFPVKAKYLVLIYAVIELLGAFQPGGAVSYIAHLGGLLLGLAGFAAAGYCNLASYNAPVLTDPANGAEAKATGRNRVVAEEGAPPDWRWRPASAPASGF